MFDPENLDAAFEELDALYPAGEAAPYARTWSAISGVYTSFNRHELPATTPDWVTVDNRPLATFEYRDAATFFSATWDLTPQTSIYIEAVHQLNSFGAVVTHAVYGTSQEGFDAEWRQTSLLTVEGGLVNRCEIFDEMDLAAAVARFDELVRPASLLDNAATRIWDRMADAFNRRHVEDFLALSAADIRYDDRRRGLRDEFEGSSAQRKAVLAMFEAPSDSVHMTAEPIAIRGSRLALNRLCFRDTEFDDRPITVEMLQTVEVNESGLLQLSVSFDPDDIDAAFEELDARYLAGEAAPYARTWSVIAGEPARFSRHELPAATPDPVYIDRRKLVSIEGVDLAASVRAVWDITSGASIYIEAVHRLSELGAVFTYVLKMTIARGLRRGSVDDHDVQSRRRSNQPHRSVRRG